MSKNKNKKFKRKIQSNPSSPINTTTSREISSTEANSDIQSEQKTEIVSEKKDHDFYATDKYHHVKKDVRNILIIMISIIIVLIGTYFLSNKTTVLSSISDWIYKILNIQAQ